MRKIVSIVLLCVMLCSLCSCQPQNVRSEIYDYAKQAVDIADDYISLEVNKDETLEKLNLIVNSLPEDIGYMSEYSDCLDVDYVEETEPTTTDEFGFADEPELSMREHALVYQINHLKTSIEIYDDLYLVKSARDDVAEYAGLLGVY